MRESSDYGCSPNRFPSLSSISCYLRASCSESKREKSLSEKHCLQSGPWLYIVHMIFYDTALRKIYFLKSLSTWFSIATVNRGIIVRTHCSTRLTNDNSLLFFFSFFCCCAPLHLARTCTLHFMAADIAFY